MRINLPIDNGKVGLIYGGAIDLSAIPGLDISGNSYAEETYFSDDISCIVSGLSRKSSFDSLKDAAIEIFEMEYLGKNKEEKEIFEVQRKAALRMIMNQFENYRVARDVRGFTPMPRSAEEITSAANEYLASSAYGFNLASDKQTIGDKTDTTVDNSSDCDPLDDLFKPKPASYDLFPEEWDSEGPISYGKKKGWVDLTIDRIRSILNVSKEGRSYVGVSVPNSVGALSNLPIVPNDQSQTGVTYSPIEQTTASYLPAEATDFGGIDPAKDVGVEGLVDQFFEQGDLIGSSSNGEIDGLVNQNSFSSRAFVSATVLGLATIIGTVAAPLSMKEKTYASRLEENRIALQESVDTGSSYAVNIFDTQDPRYQE